MSTYSFRLIAVAYAALIASLAVPAAAQEYVLDASVATNAKAVPYQVPSSGGTIPLTLLKVGTSAVTGVTVTVTPFLSEAGGRIEPSLAGDGQTGTRITLAATAAGVVACNLVVPPLSGPGPYTGSLIIRSGNAEATRQVVTITAGTTPRPATLQIAPESATQPQPFTIGNPLWGRRSPAPSELDADLGPTFDIQFADASERWDLGNITAGPLTVTKAPDGFNASQHVAFYDAAGKLVPFPRRIPASGETLTMQLRNLSAGEYVASIPFRATSAALEPRRFAFSVNVKHHVGWAVLCLSLALLLSFAASKLVELRNERQRLAKRIDDLSPRWLRDEEETFAIVWISSILTQAASLSRTWFLPSLETVHARLDKVQALEQRIDRLRRVRAEVLDAALPALARRRALKIAERIAERLDPEMDQDTLTEQTNAIVELRGWTLEGEVGRRYAADLTQSINQLLIGVDVQAIPPAGQPFVQQLVDELNRPMPTDFRQLDIREQTYAKLQILWARRKAEEFEMLLESAEKGSVERVFDAADEAAWARLEHASNRHIAHSGGPRIDAYDPLLFTFSSGDSDLDDTYLVKHKLRYHWSFVATQGDRRFPLDPTTYVPRLPHYAPFPGTFDSSVTVSFGTRSLKIDGQRLQVSRSRRFAAVNGFSAGEIVQFVLAVAAAIITGLQTFYYKAGGFGSLPDYLALFAWGATIDQLKNFLQKLPSAAQSIQGAAAATATAAGTAGAPATAASSVPATTATQQTAVQQPATPQANTTATPVSSASSPGPSRTTASPSGTASAPVANQPVPDIPAPERRQSLNLTEDN